MNKKTEEQIILAKTIFDICMYKNLTQSDTNIIKIEKIKNLKKFFRRYIKYDLKIKEALDHSYMLGHNVKPGDSNCVTLTCEIKHHHSKGITVYYGMPSNSQEFSKQNIFIYDIVHEKSEDVYK